MVSTVKVTNIDTPDNTGNITFDRPIVGDGSGLTGVSGAFEVGARGYKSASTQTISTATRTVVELDAESYDLDGGFNTTTDRYVVPTTGEYMCVGVVRYTSVFDADARMQAEFMVNGALRTFTNHHSSHAAVMKGVVADILQLNASDYVQLSTYHLTGGDETCQDGEYSTFLAIHRIS